MYYLTASLIGLLAYALLASPLSPRSADILGGWHPLAVLPMVAAATISATALRRVVDRQSKSSIVVAGVAHPFLSSLVFAALFGFLERRVQGGLGVGSAMAEALLGCLYGPLYCGLLAYFTIPLGILGVLALGRVSAHAHALAEAA
jgi:hypothetical protein